MEEMLAHSGIGEPNDDTADTRGQTIRGRATILKYIDRHLSPVRRALRKMSGDGLLGFIVYAVVFVGVFNSSTNCMQFAKLVLVAAHAEEFSRNAEYELNRDLVRFIAVSALSIICLVQFFSPRAGRRLNKLAAVVKILFVVMLIVLGAIVAGNTEKPSNDWTEKNCVLNNGTFTDSSNNYLCSNSPADRVPSDGVPPASNSAEDSAWAKALLLVLFSFEGWENATFVSSRPNPWALPVLLLLLTPDVT